MESSYITKMVIGILSNNEESRDDVLIVVKIIHDFEMNVLGKSKLDYYDLVFQGKLSSLKTIDRIWRKVQENNQQLRGKEWMLRQVQAGIIAIETIMGKNQLKLF